MLRILRTFPFLKTALDDLSVGYLAFVLSWLLLRVVFFDRFFVLAMLNLVALYLLLPLAIILPWVIWRRRWHLLAGFAIPLTFALHWFAPLFLPSLDLLQVDPGLPLKVMSFNVLASNRDFEAIAQAIRTESPDLVGFQELSPEHMPELIARLGQDYPYSVIHPENDGHTVGLLSRLAIETNLYGETSPPQPLASPPIQRGIQVHLNLQEQPLTVLVTHLAPPLSPTAVLQYGLGQWVEISRQHHLERRAQVDEIQQIAQTARAPFLMLCDCNMTNTTETYASLNQTLTDSFAKRGWGLGHTFLAATQGLAQYFPVQRLDYAWHSNRVVTLEAHVGPHGLSDHLPLVAQLRVLRDRG